MCDLASIMWEEHTRGKGVVVAVIDGRAEPTGDLEGAVLPGFSVTGSGRGDNDIDPDFHGTSMATKIAGRGTGPGVLGMAPESMILPVQPPFLNQDQYTAEALTMLAALDDPPEVVAMSYNGGGECSPEDQAAVRAAVDAGMILVASAGNGGRGPVLPSSPASCAGVIAVGAYGYFGNIGDRPDVRMIPESEVRPYVSLAGPGRELISFDPGSNTPVYFDGTSDAAAIVAGAAALVRGAYPDMSSRDLVTRLLASARPLDDRYGIRSEAWGFGSVRPLQAIEDDVPAGAPNPVYDALDQAVPPTAVPEGQEPQEPDSDTVPSPGGATDSGTAPLPEADDDSVLGLVVALAGGALVLLTAVVAFIVARSRRSKKASTGPGWPA